MDILTPKEKDKLARHLSYSATIGGWTFLGFGLLTAVLFLLPFFRLFNSDFTYDGEFITIFIPLLLAFVLPGIWLLRRRQVIRTRLDDTLLPASATVTKIDNNVPSRGFFVHLEVTAPSRAVEEATLQSYAQPTWQVGEEIELLFLPENGRFFPRHLNHNSDMGRILTASQRATQRRRLLLLGMLMGFLLVVGMTIGVIAQLTQTP